MALAQKMQAKVTKSDQVEVQLALIQLEQFLQDMVVIKIDQNGQEVWLVDQQKSDKKYKLKLRKRPYEVVVTNLEDKGYMLLWYRVNTVKFSYQEPLLKMTLSMANGTKIQHYFLMAPQELVEE